MADHPQRARPLSPHLTIYRWPVTMMTSITHRATGVGLSVGAVILAWWLVCVSNGIDGGYATFMALAGTPVGELILFGVTWALVFHFFNGIRHLAWDLGYGFPKQISERNSVMILAFSVIGALAIFAAAWTGHGGYLQ